MGSAEAIESFLDIERGLLKRTTATGDAIEYLLNVLRSLLTSQRDLPITWRDDLEHLASVVCSEAKNTSKSVEQKSFLKRTLVAGGGGLLATLNIAPIAGITLPPQVVAASTTAGVWMISEAAKNFLGVYFGSSR